MVHQAAVGKRPDRVAVLFDDEHAVASAGLVLPAALALRLGVAEIVEDCVDLGERAGAANPGSKVMMLVHGMLLGADCIDDCDVLRSGQTAAVLGHAVLAPSTLGTFLRSFTFGHVRQLDRALAQALTRAWAAGAGPGHGRLVVDVDSFVGEVHGRDKQGASPRRWIQAKPVLTRVPADQPFKVCRSGIGLRDSGSVRLAAGAAGSPPFGVAIAG